jgi:hypothetical protein
MGSGLDARHTKARGRLKSGFFVSERRVVTLLPFCCAQARNRSTAARAGRPSGLPVPSFRSSNPVRAATHRLDAMPAAFTNEGAAMSAGTTLGASSPLYAPSPSSRKRTCHGAFSLGQVPATVYASRSATDASVMVDIGTGGLIAHGRLTAAQARSAARALLAAADAVDSAQRQPQFTRGEVRHG